MIKGAGHAGKNPKKRNEGLNFFRLIAVDPYISPINNSSIVSKAHLFKGQNKALEFFSELIINFPSPWVKNKKRGEPKRERLIETHTKCLSLKERVTYALFKIL